MPLKDWEFDMIKKISVQICSYNRKELLEKVIHSLFDQSFPHEKYEIVLVDDGSTDGTSQMMQGLNSPVDLTFIQQGKVGLSAGRNKAVMKARGEIVLFIDDDVLADYRLVEEHVRFHERYPGSVVKGWVNHVSTPQRPVKPKWTRRDFSTAFFWTSNVSVSKKYLLEAGLFDEDFKEYGWEDLELGLRLKQLGLVSRMNRKAIGYHYKRPITTQDIPNILNQAQAKGRTATVFVQKNPMWRARLSTGIYPLRLLLDRIFSNSLFLNLFKRGIPKAQQPLSRWSRFCVQFLATASYFEAIRKNLSKPKIAAP